MRGGYSAVLYRRAVSSARSAYLDLNRCDWLIFWCDPGVVWLRDKDECVVPCLRW